jgi:hypothetical protein
MVAKRRSMQTRMRTVGGMVRSNQVRPLVPYPIMMP